MKRRTRICRTVADKSPMWDRWQRGDPRYTNARVILHAGPNTDYLKDGSSANFHLAGIGIEYELSITPKPLHACS